MAISWKKGDFVFFFNGQNLWHPEKEVYLNELLPLANFNLFVKFVSFCCFCIIFHLLSWKMSMRHPCLGNKGNRKTGKIWFSSHPSTVNYLHSSRPKPSKIFQTFLQEKLNIMERKTIESPSRFSILLY